MAAFVRFSVRTMNYEEAVGYLYDIPKFTKKAPLKQTEDYLAMLGIDTEMQSPKIIHVAGTNGKGSVCAYMEAMLRANGHKTGLFTSPHLVKPEERIRINGVMISEEEFTACFEEAYRVAKKMESDGQGHPTFFSFILAMGMLAFIKNEVEYIVLETGLGGRLDGTNVFVHPCLTVITSIGLDHTEYLGTTREEIAAEKAGIIKAGVPIVFVEDEVTAPVIRARAEQMGCFCQSVDKSAVKIKKKDRKGIDFSIGNRYDDTAIWRVPFAAEYQIENAMLAISAMELLFSKNDEPLSQSFRDALAHTTWEGRMEEIADGIYLDGGHNLPGIEALLAGMDAFAGSWTGKKMLLFSAVKEKNYIEMARRLLDGFAPDVIIFTEIPNERKIPLDALMALVSVKHDHDDADEHTDCGNYEHQDADEPDGPEVFGCENVADAYEFAKMIKRDEDLLLCTGSLYLVGAIKALEMEAQEGDR